jgi:DNA-binding HxlR family transcriptional regulator
MAKRTYSQYCPVAEALDVVGERWTLLIVRELLFGAKRYGELRAALPGMASNLLGDRLAELVELGIVERVELDGSTTRTAYELTPSGRELEGVVGSLARWGMRRLPMPSDDAHVEPSTALRAGLLAHVRPRQAEGRRWVCEVVVDGEPFTITIADGRVSYAAGPPVREAPDVTLTGSAVALMRMRLGGPTFDEARADGSLSIEGARTAIERFRRIFAIDAATRAREPSDT